MTKDTRLVWLALLVAILTVIALDAKLESMGAKNRELSNKLEACNTGTPMPQIVE